MFTIEDCKTSQLKPHYVAPSVNSATTTELLPQRQLAQRLRTPLPLPPGIREEPPF